MTPRRWVTPLGAGSRRIGPAPRSRPPSLRARPARATSYPGGYLACGARTEADVGGRRLGPTWRYRGWCRQKPMLRWRASGGRLRREGRTMARSLHSSLAAMIREAHAASTESATTGIPIDEVTAMRAERAREARRTVAHVLVSRRSVLKAGVATGVLAATGWRNEPRSGRRATTHRHRRGRDRRPPLRPSPVDEVEEAIDRLRVGRPCRRSRRNSPRLLRKRPDRGAAWRVHLV